MTSIYNNNFVKALIKVSCLVIIFLVCQFSLHGQSDDFIKGYVITNSEEKIEGLLREYSDKELSDVIEFKISKDSNTIYYRPDDLGSFFIEPSNYFESISISGNTNQRLFIRKILEGQTSLFRYPLNQETEYILKKQNGEFLHISKNDKVTHNSIEYDVKYIGKLKSFLSDCKAFFKIKNIIWHENKLIELVSNYNNCVDPNSESIDLNAKKKPKFGFGGLLGAKYVNMIPAHRTGIVARGSINQIPAKELVLSPQIGLVGYMQFYNRYFLQLGLTYSYYQGTFRDREVLTINQSLNFLEIPISLRYNFTSRKRTFFLMAGTTRDILLSHSTEVDFPPSATSARIFYTFNKKYAIDLHGGFGYEFEFSEGLFVNFELLYLRANLKYDSDRGTITNGIGLSTKILY